MPRIKKKLQVAAAIPTAAMPDIIFMLLIFFMVATTFKQFDGLAVLVPEAKMTQKIDAAKRDIAYIWADKNDRVMLDDQLIPLENLDELAPVLHDRRSTNPRTVISLKGDQECRMKVITDIQQQCRKAYALRVNYTTHVQN